MLKPYNRQTMFIQKLIDEIRDTGLDFPILHKPFTVQKLDNTVRHLLLSDTYYSKVHHKYTLVIEYDKSNSKVKNVLENNNTIYCEGFVRYVHIWRYRIYPYSEFYLIHN